MLLNPEPVIHTVAPVHSHRWQNNVLDLFFWLVGEKLAHLGIGGGSTSRYLGRRMVTFVALRMRLYWLVLSGGLKV